MTQIPLGGAKQSRLIAISMVPSINFTTHKRDAFAGYTLYQPLDNAVNTATQTTFNRQPAYLLDKTVQPTCRGDEAGVGGGVKSGTVGKEVRPTSASSTIFVEGKALVREGDSCTMNNGNVEGVYVAVDASLTDEDLAKWADEATAQALEDGGLWAELPVFDPKDNKPSPLPGREMTTNEIVFAKKMFGNSIDYSKVRILKEKLWFGQKDTMAIAPNGSIYFAPKVYLEDFTKGESSDEHFFIHEMTHVWQYQNKQLVALRGIGGFLFLDLPSMIGLGKGSYPYELDPNKDLLDYGIEQQASIVADYWAKKNGLFKTLETSIRATNYDDAYNTHYSMVVDTVIKK